MFPSVAVRSRCARFFLAAVIGLFAASATPATASADEPPVITDFTWYNPYDRCFVFYGFVVDEYPWSVFVAFGGVAGYNGTVAYEDGFFAVVLDLPDSTFGNASAIAVDVLNQESEVVDTFVF